MTNNLSGITQSGVRSIAEKTARLLENAAIILFGSRAQDRAAKTSDWDILVIADAFSSIRWLDRWMICTPLWETDLPVEVICLTSQEARNSIRNGNPGVCDAFFDGLFLAGNRELFQEIKGMLHDSIEQGNLIRRAAGWEVFALI
ncbi:MAG: nucleotidyltransferase domain-containing protein [Candidatus Thorarchaeota archaeon]